MWQSADSHGQGLSATWLLGTAWPMGCSHLAVTSKRMWCILVSSGGHNKTLQIGDLNHRHLSLDTGNPRLRCCPTGFQGLQMAASSLCPHRTEREREANSGVSSFFYKNTNPITGSTLMPTSNPNHLPKFWLPKASHEVLGFNTWILSTTWCQLESRSTRNSECGRHPLLHVLHCWALSTGGAWTSALEASCSGHSPLACLSAGLYISAGPPLHLWCPAGRLHCVLWGILSSRSLGSADFKSVIMLYGHE